MIRALMLSRKKDGKTRSSEHLSFQHIKNLPDSLELFWYLHFLISVSCIYSLLFVTRSRVWELISLRLTSSTSRCSGNEPATSENRAHLQVPRKMSITSAHTGSSDSSLKKPENFLQFMRAQEPITSSWRARGVATCTYATHVRTW